MERHFEAQLQALWERLLTLPQGTGGPPGQVPSSTTLAELAGRRCHRGIVLYPGARRRPSVRTARRVIWPPGRARLGTSPDATGSLKSQTIGIVVVTCWKARTAGTGPSARPAPGAPTPRRAPGAAPAGRPRGETR